MTARLKLECVKKCNLGRSSSRLSASSSDDTAFPDGRYLSFTCTPAQYSDFLLSFILRVESIVVSRVLPFHPIRLYIASHY